MDSRYELERTLAELKKVTGLNFALDLNAEEIPEDAAEKIGMLTAAWREKYDRANFIRNLLYGNISEADLYAAASRFHIPEHGRRLLYVIEFKNAAGKEQERILKQMFVTGSSDQFAVLDEKRMILIKSVAPKENEEMMRSRAHTIVDMLNTEALSDARVGISSPIEKLKDMPAAFRDAMLSLEIGRIFYSGEKVHSFSRLGIGRLIHDLPEKSCRLFIREVFGDGSPDDFDEETTQIIGAFFDNNLNISETARQLYVHRNTLVYRLEKLHQSTGLDLRNFDDAVVLKIAMMIATSLKGPGHEVMKGS